MNTAINMIDFVAKLPERPRGKACIVLTHNHKEQNKWSSKLAHLTNSIHVDLLHEFVNNECLKNEIELFSLSSLFEFVTFYSPQSVLIVSNFEFLKATWAGQSNIAGQFARRVETWSKAPALVFVTQYDKGLANQKFRRFPQHRFVIDLKETFAL